MRQPCGAPRPSGLHATCPSPRSLPCWVRCSLFVCGASGRSGPAARERSGREEGARTIRSVRSCCCATTRPANMCVPRGRLCARNPPGGLSTFADSASRSAATPRRRAVPPRAPEAPNPRLLAEQDVHRAKVLPGGGGRVRAAERRRRGHDGAVAHAPRDGAQHQAGGAAARAGGANARRVLGWRPLLEQVRQERGGLRRVRRRLAGRLPALPAEAQRGGVRVCV